MPGYEASAWVGFGVPKDTPAAIIDILNSEVNAGLSDPMMKARFGDNYPGRAIMKTTVRMSETPRRRSAPGSNERRLVTQHPRRRILSLAAGAAALPVVSRIAWPQAYPTRPVRLIVGFAAGGQTDIIARLLGQWLSARLGQPLVIENRPGAGTNIATEAVVKAPPDGHTLLFVTSANATNPALYGYLNFNFLQDIVPVASIERQTYVMAVNPSFPANTVIDLSLTPKPIRAASPWRPGAMGPSRTSPASCSRRWPESTWFMCPIAAVR
jgi:tripartite-type tricarboxylate transporter receptor subunit TctC